MEQKYGWPSGVYPSEISMYIHTCVLIVIWDTHQLWTNPSVDPLLPIFLIMGTLHWSNVHVTTCHNYLLIEGTGNKSGAWWSRSQRQVSTRNKSTSQAAVCQRFARSQVVIMELIVITSPLNLSSQALSFSHSPQRGLISTRCTKKLPADAICKLGILV